MKRVLFITNIPSPYRVDFFNELGAKADINLDVLFLEKPEEHTARSLDWFNNSYNSFNAIFLDRKIHVSNNQFINIDVIKYLKNDYNEIIIGGYSYLSFAFAIVILKIRNIPFSIEIDGAFLNEESILKKMIKKFLISSATKWYSTGRLSDEYLLHYGAQKDGLIRYNFSSLMSHEIDNIYLSNIEWITRKESIRRTLGINEQYVVLAVGQFIERKGFDILIESSASIPDSIGVYIVGGKPIELYTKIIDKHKIENVHFVDFLNKEKLKEYYIAADIFAFPTREDIWGLVVNEAMAFGLPVITTDKCAAGIELIEDGVTGRICETDNVDMLTNSIIQFMNKDLYNIRLKVLNNIQNYTIEHMAEDHWKEICGDSNGKN